MLRKIDRLIAYETIKKAYDCGYIDDDLRKIKKNIDETILSLGDEIEKIKNEKITKLFLTLEELYLKLENKTSEKYFEYGSLVPNSIDE